MKIFIKHLNTGQETDDVNITWARSFDLFGCYLHGYLHCLIPLSIYLLLSTQHTYSNTTNSVSFLKKKKDIYDSINAGFNALCCFSFGAPVCIYSHCQLSYSLKCQYRNRCSGLTSSLL